MYRLSNGTQVSALPEPSSDSGIPGYATPGVPGGQQASIIDADAFNVVQEELVGICLAAGVILDKKNNSQVLGALSKLFAPLIAPQFSASGSDVPTTPTPDGSNPLQIANIGSVLSQIASGGGLPSQKAATGYVQLPGGLIMQFGSLNSGASGQTVIQFPIKFPGFPVGIWANEANASGGWSTGKITAHAPAAGATQTGATILSAVYGETANQWTLAGGIFFSWLAIGF